MIQGNLAETENSWLTGLKIENTCFKLSFFWGGGGIICCFWIQGHEHSLWNVTLWTWRWTGTSFLKRSWNQSTFFWDMNMHITDNTKSTYKFTDEVEFLLFFQRNFVLPGSKHSWSNITESGIEARQSVHLECVIGCWCWGGTVHGSTSTFLSGSLHLFMRTNSFNSHCTVLCMRSDYILENSSKMRTANESSFCTERCDAINNSRNADQRSYADWSKHVSGFYRHI